MLAGAGLSPWSNLWGDPVLRGSNAVARLVRMDAYEQKRVVDDRTRAKKEEWTAGGLVALNQGADPTDFTVDATAAGRGWKPMTVQEERGMGLGPFGRVIDEDLRRELGLVGPARAHAHPDDVDGEGDGSDSEGGPDGHVKPSAGDHSAAMAAVPLGYSLYRRVPEGSETVFVLFPPGQVAAARRLLDFVERWLPGTLPVPTLAEEEEVEAADRARTAHKQAAASQHNVDDGGDAAIGLSAPSIRDIAAHATASDGQVDAAGAALGDGADSLMTIGVARAVHLHAAGHAHAPGECPANSELWGGARRCSRMRARACECVSGGHNLMPPPPAPSRRFAGLLHHAAPGSARTRGTC